MTRLATVLLLLASGLAAAPPSRAAQAGPSVATLAAAYAAGDHAVVTRAFGTAVLWQSRAAQVLDVADRWRAEALDRRAPVWDPLRIAFLLDIAGTVMGFDREASTRLLRITRELAIARAGTAGDGQGGIDDHDRAEIAAHRVALAVLFVIPSEARAYLRAIESRISAYRRFEAGRTLVERLEMMPALLAEAETRPFVVDTGMANAADVLRPTAVLPPWPQPGRALAARLSTVLDRLTQSSGVPGAWQAERDVRRGLTLLRLGKPADARAVLASAEAATDASVRYWARLVTARSLAAQGDIEAAIATYESAVETAGAARAQTAIIALAATEFLMGRRDKAEAWARQARTGPSGVDPWWEYWYGDQRFVGQLMQQIRSTAP